MSEGRWTLRGIPERVRQTVRQICQCTGMSAGAVIAAAVEHFAKAHPEVLREQQPDDDDALQLLLQVLKEKLEVQGRLFAELADRVGPIRVDR